MPPIIADVLRSRKAHNVALVVLVVLVATSAFGLGRLSRSPREAEPVVLRESTLPRVVREGEMQPDMRASVSDAVFLKSGEYVASKSGKVYHLPWCAGAQRISEKNKVWFKTKEEAEAAGYRPAQNCKGI